MHSIKYVLFGLFLVGLAMVGFGVSGPDRTIWLVIGVVLGISSGVALQVRRTEIQNGGMRYILLLIVTVIIGVIGVFLDLMARR